MRNVRLGAYFGKVVSPLTVVKLLASWGNDQGRVFRVGYYSRQDGLNCVWLVNDKGEYEQTTDQHSIERDFEILKQSDELDLFGANRQIIGKLSDADVVARPAL
jgi:hypothetical protein